MSYINNNTSHYCEIHDHRIDDNCHNIGEIYTTIDNDDEIIDDDESSELLSTAYTPKSVLFDTNRNMKHVPNSTYPPSSSYNKSNNNGNYDIAIMGFTFPITIEWYFSPTGAEFCHNYFWIFKDLAWTQGWKQTSLLFGIAAILWSLIIIYHAIKYRNVHEIINGISLLLWLFANFWWMTGEVHDAAYPDMPSLYDIRSTQSSYVLETALSILMVYYLILLPCEVVDASEEAIAVYDDGELSPRFSYFTNFRQYENVHMIFWAAKDLAWDVGNVSLWFASLLPTLFLSVDYFVISYNCENSIVDTVHYLTQLIWVLGNSVWAFGEFFFSDYDDPESLWQDSGEALRTARWYSSWLLIFSLVPVVCLYAVWIPLTCSGRLKPKRKKRRSPRSVGSSPRDSLDAFQQAVAFVSGYQNASEFSDDNHSIVYDRFGEISPLSTTASPRVTASSVTPKSMYQSKLHSSSSYLRLESADWIGDEEIESDEAEDVAYLSI